MPYIPDEIGLYIMLYCSKYDMVKLMCALGYSTSHMDEIFAIVHKYRDPVITTLKWRGMVVTAHDDYIVDVYYEKDYASVSSDELCSCTYHLRYKLSQPYPCGITRSKYMLKCDEDIKNISDEGNDVNIFYPQDVYFADNGSYCTLSEEKHNSINSEIEYHHVMEPRFPGIYEYHDMLFGLALLAKRGYWMKSTYNQCYKEGDYDHWFWDNMDSRNNNLYKVYYHAIGNKIVNFVIYRKDIPIAGKYDGCYDCESLDQRTRWIVRNYFYTYGFGLNPYESQYTSCLEAVYSILEISFRKIAECGYRY